MQYSFIDGIADGRSYNLRSTPDKVNITDDKAGVTDSYTKRLNADEVYYALECLTDDKALALKEK